MDEEQNWREGAAVRSLEEQVKGAQRGLRALVGRTHRHFCSMPTQGSPESQVSLRQPLLPENVTGGRGQSVKVSVRTESIKRVCKAPLVGSSQITSQKASRGVVDTSFLKANIAL